jgi:predicted dehydrogenase
MKRPMSVGIIGCGWAGVRHAKAFVNQGASVAWAVDVSMGRAKAVGGLQVGTRVSADYREALRDPALDAVDICLPHNLHALMTIEAVRNGKHVLCEKPLAVTLPDADRMIAASEKAGVILMVAENEVFSPLYLRIKRLVDSGAIGAPALVQMTRGCYFEQSFKKERPWFLDEKAVGGGMMMSGGVHDFEKLRMIIGEVTAVFARKAPQRFAEMQGDDTSVAMLRFAGGAIGIMVQSYLMKSAMTAAGTEEHTMRIEGEHGSIRAAGTNGGKILLFRDSLKDPLLSRVPSETEIVVPEVDTFELEVGHFIECVRTGKEPITAGRRMRKPLELVLAAYKSMRQNREVLIARG